MVFGQDKSDNRFKIIKQYRKLELLKTLDLPEENEAVVLPLLNKVEKNRETHFDNQKSITQKLRKALEKPKDDKKIKKLITELMGNEEIFQKKEKKLSLELQKHIGHEKFAKYLLFQMYFGRQIRDKMDKMHRLKPHDFPEK